MTPPAPDPESPAENLAENPAESPADGASDLAALLVRRRETEAKTVVDVDEPCVKMVIAALADTFFAFPGLRIREILPGTPAFFLPGCPAGLEGVINVRGDIEPVLSLRSLLRFPEAPSGAGSRILLAKGDGLRAGLRVDAVLDVVDVPQSQVQPPPATVSDALRPWVLGAFLHTTLPVTVLDLDRVLQDFRHTVE